MARTLFLSFLYAALITGLTFQAAADTQQQPAQHEGGDAKQPARVEYTCPMHPEVVSDKPGKCPQCGMELTPKEEKDAKATYRCPMHDEIVAEKPGKCPICGMALEKSEE